MESNEKKEVLDTAKEQLTTIQIDFTRLFHNLDAIINNVGRVVESTEEV